MARPDNPILSLGRQRDWLDSLLGATVVLREIPLFANVGYAPFLVLWLAYGFSLALLLTLVVRKSAVAVVIAVLVGAGAAGFWLPSLLGGGLSLWQVLGVPVLLLAASRLAMRAWTSDRLDTGRPAAALIGCAVLAVAWIAANLGARPLEVPDVGEPFDVKASFASLPTPEHNEAGRLINRGMQALFEKETQVRTEMFRRHNPPPPLPGEPPRLLSDPTRNVLFSERLFNAAGADSWPAGDTELNEWLDLMFAGAWANQFWQAADLPLGMVEDPRGLMLNRTIPDDVVQRRGLVDRLYTARALQLQSRGKNAEALELFAVALAVRRNLLNQAPLWLFHWSQWAEVQTLNGFNRWLDHVGPQPDLLRRALAVLHEHETQRPPLSGNVKAEYLVFQNSLDDPSRWLFRDTAASRWQIDVLTTAWSMPWERERRARLVDAVFAGWLRSAETDYWQLPAPASPPEGAARKPPSREAMIVRDWLPPAEGSGVSLTRERLRRLLDGAGVLNEVFPWDWSIIRARDTQVLCQVRAERLKTALALYQVEQGKPAARLADLVPRFLAALPADPFSGQSFLYRVSRGERITDRHLIKEVASGQGVLWSVGPDGNDNGGTVQDKGVPMSDVQTWADKGLDLIFLVPRWPGPRKGG
jgi:hypothetical protein